MEGAEGAICATGRACFSEPAGGFVQPSVQLAIICLASGDQPSSGEPDGIGDRQRRQRFFLHALVLLHEQAVQDNVGHARAVQGGEPGRVGRPYLTH
jgi:hypothetical protein